MSHESIPGLNCLLVEDCHDEAAEFRALTQELGVECVHLDKGASIRTVSLAEINCAVIDLLLPDIHGVEVGQLLRERGYEGPMIAAAASTNRLIYPDCLAVGFDLIIQKPYTYIFARTAVEYAKLNPVRS